MKQSSTDFLRVIHFSPVCACGRAKVNHRIFCGTCWSELSPEMREEWNAIVIRTYEKTKREDRSPYSARTFYRRALRELGPSMLAVAGTRNPEPGTRSSPEAR